MLDNNVSLSTPDLPILPGVKINKNLSLPGRDLRGILIKGENAYFLDRNSGPLAGLVKCVYVDPPYNNLDDFFDYSDTDSHEEWLAKTSSHIFGLWSLLREDGSLWVSIDDRQVHYLKVALDKLIGRKNFVSSIIWEHRKTRENRRVFSSNHEYVLVYCKNQIAFKFSRNHLPADDELISRYKNPDNDPRGPWQSISLNAQAGHATASQFYKFISPMGFSHVPPQGRCWAYSKSRINELIDDNRIWFGKTGNSVPRLKKFFNESRIGLTPHTLWKAEEVGTTDSAKKDFIRDFPGIPVFDTPKPEALIRRIIEISTNPNDIVLDSYLGSGTTALVAVKSGRKFVGIERADRAAEISMKRIRKYVTSHEAKFLDNGFIYGNIK